jgi:hypothetical protein
VGIQASHHVKVIVIPELALVLLNRLLLQLPHGADVDDEGGLNSSPDLIAEVADGRTVVTTRRFDRDPEGPVIGMDLSR